MLVFFSCNFICCLLLPSNFVAAQDHSKCNSPFAHYVSRELFMLFWSLILVFLRLAIRKQSALHFRSRKTEPVLIKYIPGHLHSLGLGDTQEHLQAEGRADLQTSQPCSTSLQAHQEHFYPALPLTAASTPAYRIFLLYTSMNTFFLPSSTSQRLDRSWSALQAWLQLEPVAAWFSLGQGES